LVLQQVHWELYNGNFKNGSYDCWWSKYVYYNVDDYDVLYDG